MRLTCGFAAGDGDEPGIQAVYDGKLQVGKRAEEQRPADAVFEEEQRRAEEDRRYEQARRKSAISTAMTEKEEKLDDDEAALLDAKIPVDVRQPTGFLATDYI